MDTVLVDYLRSGKAWVLVGSGASTQMGYPTWNQMARMAYEFGVSELGEATTKPALDALKAKNPPEVFNILKGLLGIKPLTGYISSILRPKAEGRIYELMAKWPIPVYLTTNYDDELQNHLAAERFSFIPHLNSEDDFSILNPELSGAIFKIHGDLLHEPSLILTSQDYSAISQSQDWQYWRTKMTSVFQMNRLVIIGHSLNDPNIKHILETAKLGAGILLPICWVAPDVTKEQRETFLEQYRIRVITYDNHEGDHRNLLKLVEKLSNFIPSRTVSRIKDQVVNTPLTAPGVDNAAPGFFVFNAAIQANDWNEKRIQSIGAAILSVIPQLKAQKQFTLLQALQIAGWPKEYTLPDTLKNDVETWCISNKILIKNEMGFALDPQAENIFKEKRGLFDHSLERFKKSIELRLKRDYAELEIPKIELLVRDIVGSLAGFFREGGLTLASILYSEHEESNLPVSIIPFITRASARYDDLLMRQAFFCVTVDLFINPEQADVDFLGRICQGYFAFHSLGVFGDVALQRLKLAKTTIWIIDSNMLIGALALGSAGNMAFRDCISQLKNVGIRLFTIDSLFKETVVHLWYADNEIGKYANDHSRIVAAARGDTPYKRGNTFLEGYTRWQDANGNITWANYLNKITGSLTFNQVAMQKALVSLGVEVISLPDWPGFDAKNDTATIEEFTDKIKRIYDTDLEKNPDDEEADQTRKAKPEAEALTIITGELSGKFHMLETTSAAYFVSSTSILNAVMEGARVTWQPSAFLGFVSTLGNITAAKASVDAFDTILMQFAQTGTSIIDEGTVKRVFGAPIEQALLDIEELRSEYKAVLETKYGEPLESVLARVPYSQRQLARIQLLNEAAQAAIREKQRAEETAKSSQERAQKAEERVAVVEKKLGRMQKYKNKVEIKHWEAKKKNKSKTKKHNRKNKNK